MKPFSRTDCIPPEIYALSKKHGNSRSVIIGIEKEVIAGFILEQLRFTL